jgi:hypothetical protein
MLLLLLLELVKAKELDDNSDVLKLLLLLDSAPRE